LPAAARECSLRARSGGRSCPAIRTHHAGRVRGAGGAPSGDAAQRPVRPVPRPDRPRPCARPRAHRGRTASGRGRPRARLSRPGPNRIEALFQAAIAAAGASIIRYEDDTDGSVYLYTLLVPADANQLFPSFDQPDLKARVALHTIVPADWRVLANGAQADRV